MIKYGDKVIIVEGFYEGCKGVAVDYSMIPMKGTIFYNIEINTYIGNCAVKKTIEVSEHKIKLLSREV